MENGATLMQPLSSLDYFQIDTARLMTADLTGGQIVACANDDFEMVSGCTYGNVISLKVFNYYGTWNAIGVDDFGHGSEHIVFQLEGSDLTDIFMLNSEA
jgi:hypothetical protein